MDIGVPVKLYWRKAGENSFEAPSEIKTEEGPLAGKGIVKGETLVNWAKALGLGVNNAYVLSVAEGSKPEECKSKVLLNADAIYNMYIFAGANGEYSLYLVSPEKPFKALWHGVKFNVRLVQDCKNL